jgi:Iml2/Tetratricopeptide repeat protein 39
MRFVFLPELRPLVCESLGEMSIEPCRTYCIQTSQGLTVPREVAKITRNVVLATGILLLAVSPAICAQAHSAVQEPPEGDRLTLALDHFYNLEYDAAQQQLKDILAEHLDDLRAMSDLARVWMEREMYRRQLLEAQAYSKGGEAFRASQGAETTVRIRQEVFGQLDQVARLAQDRLRRDPQDKDALYWLGVSHLIRAVFFLSLEKSKMEALSEAKAAQKYHSRLLKLDPDFADADLVVGTYDYIVGSLPWYTKVVAALIGYRGSRQRGLEELKRAAEQGRWTRTDAQTFLSILDYRDKEYAKAIVILENLERAYPRNALLPQEIARAYKAQENWQAAAEEYDSMGRKYEAHAPGFTELPVAKIYYQAGEAYMHLGRHEEALRRYEKAAGLHDGSIYDYRAELAAAAIELKRNRHKDAILRYERVVKAVPDTEEGRAATQALKRLGADSSPSPLRQSAE